MPDTVTPQLNPDTPPKPIKVAVSPTGDQTATATRDLLVILSVLPALIAVLGKKDLTAIINYISSVEFAPALGIIVGAVVLVWRQWLARRKHSESLKMARNVNNDIAIVKGERQ